MKTIRLTILIFIFLITAAASALAFGHVAYPDRPLNLRSARSARAEWVGTLYPGQMVRIAHEKDGWVAVYEPDATDGSEAGAVGFSNAKYLKKRRTRYEPKPWGELMYSPTKLNIRSKPSLKGQKVAVLHAGDRVIVDFPEDDWVMAFSPEATIRSHMNGIGFCSGKYLKPVPSSTGQANTDGVEAEADYTNTTGNVAQLSSGSGQIEGNVAFPASAVQRVAMTAKVNVRQSRTSNSPLVRTLKPNEIVQIGLQRNGWYAVFAANDTIRSESTSLGYALQSLVDKSSRPASLERVKEISVVEKKEPAKPEPAAIAEPARASRSEVERHKGETVSLAAIKAEATSKPVETTQSARPVPERAVVSAASKEQKTFVIDRSAITPTKRPDPTPDKTSHGYKYKLVEKSETRQFGEPWITLKVFLATNKVPDSEALRDFATTLWRKHKRITKKLAVLIYLPGMDLDDLSYGVIKFDDDKMLELWYRKATLFGTKFMK